MDSCEKYIGLISELIDGEISDADRSELEIHLEFCPECKKAAEALEAISANFPKEEEVPANFTAGTMAKIKAEASKPVGLKKFISGYGKYTGLAAALVVILLGVQVFNGGGSKDTAAPMAPMAMMADSAVKTEAAAGGTAVNGAVAEPEVADGDVYYDTADRSGFDAPAEADIPESAPADTPIADDTLAEDGTPDAAPLPEPTPEPQFSVTVQVTDINELYKKMGYTERFYSVSRLSEPAPDAFGELIDSGEAAQIFKSLDEIHYKVPMTALNELDPEVFTEIVFDDLTARYGLVILMPGEE